MKIRYADGRNYVNMLKKHYICESIHTNAFQGYVALLTIEKAKKECYVPRENRKDECILADGYQWLEIYPEGKHVAITAMYNAKQELVEWYFDVVNAIGETDGVPYIQDLYLDVVITYLGEQIVLDEDELLEAKETGKITNDQYALALKVGAEIQHHFSTPEAVVAFKQFSDEMLQYMQSLSNNHKC